jgi:hypothetical protein
MTNLLEKNIFIKMNQNKFNPDINTKTEDIKNERENNIFIKSNTTYNSITNHVPLDIKSQKDLELNKDKPLENLKDIILNKAKERHEQEQLFKPTKQKIVNNEISDIIQNFTELKIDQNNFKNEQQNIINNNKHKYENILQNLKSLRILE